MKIPAVVRPIDATSLKSILEFSLSIGQLNTVGDVLSLIDSEPEIEIPKGNLFWRDAKKELPPKDGFYIGVYDSWFENCIATREFKDGRWVDEERRGFIKFWMPIPEIPGDNE
jgi:hypothetical protein